MNTNRRNRVVILDDAIRRKSILEQELELHPVITCGENATQFLQSTAMHGMRYVGDSKLSVFERIFFTAAISTMFGLATFFISTEYKKWTDSPIIITLNSASTSISEIPFPAITICNMNQARKSVVQNITKGSSEYNMLRSICRKDIDENAVSSTDTDWLDFREFIIKVSHSCSDILITCRFAQKYEKCLEIFETVLTDDGLCCTFNSVHKNYMMKDFIDNVPFDEVPTKYKPIKWTPETGFSDENSRTTTYPRRGFGVGSHMGLTVLINSQSYDYYCSSTISKGFKVLLHPPTETPKISNLGFSITPGSETRVVITPAISDASDQIRKISRHQRRCLFESESNLSYFRVYSRKNCEMECETRLLQQICGCIMYYMPRIGDSPVICSRENIDCYTDVLLSIELVTNETYRCDCLPGCFDVNYGVSVSSSEIAPEILLQVNKVNNATAAEYSKSNLAALHVFYTTKFFRSHTKEELMGFTSFLSNIGGLLGLFMGFSVLSLIEIVYFMTIRPYCATRKRRMKKRHLSIINQLWSNENRRGWNTERNILHTISSGEISNQSQDQKYYSYNRRSLAMDDDKQMYMD